MTNHHTAGLAARFAARSYTRFNLRCFIATLICLATSLLITPAQAQITFRAAGAQITGTGASITPVIPAGVQAGDLAILIVAGRPTDTTQPAAPAGWALRSASLREAGANDLKVMTFYRVTTGLELVAVSTR